MLLYILFAGGILILSIIFRISATTGLVLPLAYGIIAPTLFSEWFHANQQLAEGIGWALVAFVALMWVISFVRKIAGLLHQRREDKAVEAVFLYRLRRAKSQGINAVSTEGLWR